MNYKNLVFLGTSHIAKQSMNDVKKYIEAEMPDIIAIEFDKKRLPALMNGQVKIELKMIGRIGVKGFLFSLFGAWAEKKLGKIVGVAPGSEMRLAVKLARKNNLEIALVDQDIEITLRRLSKELAWKEKWNFMSDIFKSVFAGKKEVDFDLRYVPSNKVIKKLVEKLKERYPNVHKVLIEERNAAIAENLKELMSSNPDKKILVILGAGHVEDVIGLIKKENTRISYSFSAG